MLSDAQILNVKLILNILIRYIISNISIYVLLEVLKNQYRAITQKEKSFFGSYQFDFNEDANFEEPIARNTPIELRIRNIKS